MNERYYEMSRELRAMEEQFANLIEHGFTPAPSFEQRMLDLENELASIKQEGDE